MTGSEETKIFNKESQREKLRIIRSKKWIIRYPLGTTQVITNLKGFCKANGLMYAMLQKGAIYKGYSARQVSHNS